MHNNINNPSIKLLLNGILTIQDVRTYLEYVRQIEQLLYNVNIDFVQEVSNMLPHDVKEKLLNVLHVSKIDPKDSQSMQIFLADFRSKIKALPVMGLTVAYDPSEKDLRDYSSFLFTNLGIQVVFHLIKDTSIVGGCKIEFNGRVMDYSLQKMIGKHPLNSVSHER